MELTLFIFVILLLAGGYFVWGNGVRLMLLILLVAPLMGYLPRRRRRLHRRALNNRFFPATSTD
jgi:hypothetical protein